MSQFRRPLEAYRRSPGRYVQGRWTEGERTPLPLTASVQPARDKDLKSLPEGRREASTLAVYTSTELFSVDEVSRTNSDVIVYRGDEYEVVHVERWQNTVIDHYKALIQRKTIRPCDTDASPADLVVSDALVSP